MSPSPAPVGASLSAHPAGTPTSDRAVQFRRPGYLGGPVPTLIRGHDGQGRSVTHVAAPSALDPADVRALVAQGLCAWQIARLRGCRPVHVAEVAFLERIALNPSREREATHGWRSGPRMKGLR